MPRKGRFAPELRLAALLIAAAVATPGASHEGRPTNGAASPRLGFDLLSRDTTTAPGDDFDAFASGGWERSTVIPPDRSTYGVALSLRATAQERVHALLEEQARRPGSSRSGDLYASYLDETKVASRGIAPITPLLRAIADAKNRTELAVVSARLQRDGVPLLFRMGVEADARNPSRNVFALEQGGLGLPGRDYYLGGDTAATDIRVAYQTYLAEMLGLIGQPSRSRRAAAVVAFETKLAAAQRSREERRDAEASYNRLSYDEVVRRSTGFAWAEFAAAAQLPRTGDYIVAEPATIAAEAAAWGETPLPVLKDYLTLHALTFFAPFLPEPFEKARFALFDAKLLGTPEPSPRWRTASIFVQNALGDDIGRAYVARFFPPAAKAAADELVRNLIAAMGDRIRRLDWMAADTKGRALAKLANFRANIGYPDHWLDYAGLVIRRDDLIGNVERVNAFAFDHGLAKLPRPVDPGEWFVSPMEVNAFAEPNRIYFPAALFQPPFFDPGVDPAINYGSIGAIIGHEISHNFDDQGRKYDEQGALSDWWTPADVARFTALTDRLVRQYDGYEPLPGVHLRGRLTLGENIADLAGLTVAYEAYHRSLAGRAVPVIDATTGDQRFFYGWAVVNRVKYREAALREHVLNDTHSPARFRVWTVRNLDPWYAAFGVAPGAALHLAPADRVRIW